MNGDGKDRPIGTVRFHPGDGVAVVGDRVVVLVLDAPTSALVQDCVPGSLARGC